MVLDKSQRYVFVDALTISDNRKGCVYYLHYGHPLDTICEFRRFVMLDMHNVALVH